MPLYRRIPKRGFTNLFAKTVATINVRDLERFEEGATVDEAALRKAGLVNRKADMIKVLGDGELDKALTVKVHAASATATQKIEKAGGTVELVETTAQ